MPQSQWALAQLNRGGAHPGRAEQSRRAGAIIADDAGGQQPNWQIEGVRVLVAADDDDWAREILAPDKPGRLVGPLRECIAHQGGDTAPDDAEHEVDEQVRGPLAVSVTTTQPGDDRTGDDRNDERR